METTSMPETTPLAVRPRRIAFFGAGPLPGRGSTQAPGVANRLWHFVQPALAAGHECLVFSLEPQAPERGAGAESAEPDWADWRDRRWRRLRVNVEDLKKPERFAKLVERFDPQALVAAGTLQAGAAACALAGQRPVWVDLFGDPLSEIQAKAAILGERFSADEQIHVWSLMLSVLRRADAFSTVSRRQADALLGQLALVGRLDAASAAQAGPEELLGARAMIHTMPCAVESLDFLSAREGFDRAAWLGRFGLPAEARVALWSGGFNAWVDAATLVRGAEQALERDERLHLVATGGELPGYLGRVYEEFLALARASRHAARIHPLGWLPLEDAHGWLRAADVGLMVDRPCAETRLGARNRLLFFAAARRPVVASRGTEVVANMAAAGALVDFPSGDAAAMARAILALLNDAEKSRLVGERSEIYCREHYLFSATTQSFSAFLANPRRVGAAPADGTTGEASTFVARFLDLERRAAEGEELRRYRAGRWARLKGFLRKR